MREGACLKILFKCLRGPLLPANANQNGNLNPIRSNRELSSKCRITTLGDGDEKVQESKPSVWDCLSLRTPRKFRVTFEILVVLGGQVLE